MVVSSPPNEKGRIGTHHYNEIRVVSATVIDATFRPYISRTAEPLASIMEEAYESSVIIRKYRMSPIHWSSITCMVLAYSGNKRVVKKRYHHTALQPKMEYPEVHVIESNGRDVTVLCDGDGEDD